MSVVPPLSRRASPWTAAALTLQILTGCESVTTVPTNAHLAGDWRLDKSASDDPDAAIAKAVGDAETKLRHRLAKYGYGPEPGAQSGNHDTSADAADYSFDTPGDRYGGPGLVGPDFRGLKVRLREELIAPRRLQLITGGDEISVGEEGLPPREYRIGERLSRMDEYGTATIRPSWDHDAFVLKLNYSSPRATRSDTYSVDAAGGKLTLTRQLIDPTVGKILVRSVYLRN
jgi:hypothetical protein